MKCGRKGLGAVTLAAGMGWMTLIGPGSAIGQVFPPRQPAPAPTQPASPPAPQQQANPASLTKVVPFSALLGDPTKAFVQLGNLQSPMDSSVVLGRGLSGRLTVDPYIHEAGNGSKIFVHLNGLSNPPTVTSEGNEVHLRFQFHTILFKSFYRNYNTEGDQAIGDPITDRAVVDVYLTPVTDQRGMPTYQSARVVFTGELREPEKCTYWFDVIFPVNICDIAKKYLNNLKPVVEHGMRELLQHPQTRAQFDQMAWQVLRADLLTQAGINPASRAQIQIVQTNVRGTDIAVSYFPVP